MPIVFFLLLLSSPAEQRIADAQKVIQTGPKTSQAFDTLAAAYVRRARETGNAGNFEKASEAIRHSLEISPSDYDARKIHVAILLGEQNFPEALIQAKAVNKQVPDDVAGWGLLADANTELGNYEEAEKDVQWMLDLRPGNVPAFIKAAGLRAIFGDPEGAIEFYKEALRRTPPTETEEQAWLVTQIAHMNLLAGNSKQAGALFDEALKLYPDYHLALQARGSVADLGRRAQIVKTPTSLYDWAAALENSGLKDEAETVYAKFEAQSKPGPELVFYYADHRKDPAKALAIAEQLQAVRHDVRTLDAYAWALYRSGNSSSAKAQIEKVLAVGTREPSYLCHAAAIEGKPCAAH